MALPFLPKVLLLGLWIGLITLCKYEVNGQDTTIQAVNHSHSFPAPHSKHNKVLGVMLSYNFGHFDPLVLILNEYVSMCEGTNNDGGLSGINNESISWMGPYNLLDDYSQLYRENSLVSAFENVLLSYKCIYSSSYSSIYSRYQQPFRFVYGQRCLNRA